MLYGLPGLPGLLQPLRVLCLRLQRLAAEAADKDAVIAELLRQKVAGERRHECQVAHLQSLHKVEVESLK